MHISITKVLIKAATCLRIAPMTESLHVLLILTPWNRLHRLSLRLKPSLFNLTIYHYEKRHRLTWT